MSDRMFYVAEDPERPGTAYAACFDDPNDPDYCDIAVERWELEGAKVHRVDGIEMVRLMNAWQRTPENA